MLIEYAIEGILNICSEFGHPFTNELRSGTD
jgi:hypothetical protein